MVRSCVSVKSLREALCLPVCSVPSKCQACNVYYESRHLWFIKLSLWPWTNFRVLAYQVYDIRGSGLNCSSHPTVSLLCCFCLNKLPEGHAVLPWDSHTHLSMNTQHTRQNDWSHRQHGCHSDYIFHIVYFSTWYTGSTSVKCKSLCRWSHLGCVLVHISLNVFKAFSNQFQYSDKVRHPLWWMKSCLV